MKRNQPFQIVPWILLMTGFAIQGCGVITDYSPTQTPSATFAPLTISPPTRTEEACGFVWAYKDLPDLSKLIQKKLREYQTGANARAQAFGEDCVYSSGKSEFHALETDFYVTLRVDDLKDEDELGDWISRIMPELVIIPRDKLMGPQEGFCEFKFTKNVNEFVIVRVPLEKFRTEANRLKGAELYRLFSVKP